MSQYPTASIDEAIARVEELLPGPLEVVALARRSGLTSKAAEETEEEGFWADGVFILQRSLDAAIERWPGAKQAWRDLDRACYALIGVLSRDKEVRRMAASRLAVPHGLTEALAGAGWLSIMLRVLDDEPLLVIHPASTSAFRMRMSGVSSNFQLHILLANTLLGPRRGIFAFFRPKRPLGEPRPHADAVAVYDGSGPQTIERSSSGVWNLYQWRAIDAGGSLPDNVPTEQWVWGEGVPADIDKFEEVRTLILGAPAYARSWNTAREFAGLSASLDTEEVLPPDEVRFLLARLGQTSGGETA